MAGSRDRRDALYALGIDFGTQSAKALVLDVRSAEVIHTDSFEYDTAFPKYGTEGGVLPSQHPALRHTSPLMLLEALDLVFGRLQRNGIDLGSIGAVKIDAMQMRRSGSALSLWTARRICCLSLRRVSPGERRRSGRTGLP